MQFEKRFIFEEEADASGSVSLARLRLPEQPRAPSCGESRPVTSADELRAFVSENADGIYRLASCHCYHNDENTQEVVQELYPRLLCILETSPEGLRNPWAITRTITARLAVDLHRRDVRRNRFKSLPDGDSLREQRRQPDPSPLELDELRQAVANLPTRLRAIVQGIFLDGRKAKDVAADVNLSPARVTELKQDALRRLRSFLDNSELV